MTHYQVLHTYQVKATDNAGNFTETAVQTVMVDTVPPTLNARTALNVRETLHYELTDAMSGLSQFTIVVADKDNLQPPSASVWALTGNAAGGDFRWYATFGDAAANVGWYPLTMTVTDAAGNQTTVSGSIEVKHNDLLYMGLIQPHNSPAQSNPSGGGGASAATAGGMPMPGIAEAPIIVPPAPVAESAPAGTENPTPAAQANTPLAGMRAQFGSSNFTAGNQSTTTPTANPAILWGAAASAMLGASLAEWQRKREEESARLAASRGGGGDGGTDEGGRSDVQEKRRAQKLAKVNPGLARQQARDRAVRAEIAKVTAKEQKAWERERVAKIEATEAYKDSEEKGQYLKQELNRIRAQEKAYRDALKEAQAAQEREEYLHWLRTGQNPPEGCEDITSASERLALYMQTSEYKAGQARLVEQEEQAERENAAYLHWLRTGQNPPEGYDEAASASERLALYKETPEYQAEQARLAEWQRLADEQAAQAAYQVYREGEREAPNVIQPPKDKPWWKKLKEEIVEFKKWYTGEDVGYTGTQSSPLLFLISPPLGIISGHGPRQLIGKWFGYDKSDTASSFTQLFMRGLLQYDHTTITGDLLEAIKGDPESKNAQISAVQSVKNDPRFGKEDFTKNNLDVPADKRVIPLGGAGGPWTLASFPAKLWAYRLPQTKAMRNATWSYEASATMDKNLSVNITIKDKLDLRSSKNRNWLYNAYVVAFGIPYHFLLGGNANMTTSASWTVDK